MKKIVAMMLALMLVLVSVSALAAANTIDTSNWKTDTTEIVLNNKLKKAFTKADGTTAATTYPTETLSFSVTPDTKNPETVNITVSDYDPAAVEGYIVVTIPGGITKAGKYTYTINEIAGTTQGVTYSTQNVTLSFIVEYNYTNSKLVVNESTLQLGIKNGDTKDEKVINKYDVGTYELTKEVTGNLGKKDQPFDVTVTFAAESGKKIYADIVVTKPDGTPDTISISNKDSDTYDLQIKDGETFAFANIPAGVTVTAAEASKHADPDTSVNYSDGSKGYKVTYDGETTDAGEQIAADTKAETKITNNKDFAPDTGIALDTVPYLMIMAIALMGVAMMIVRRREEM